MVQRGAFGVGEVKGRAHVRAQQAGRGAHQHAQRGFQGRAVQGGLQRLALAGEPGLTFTQRLFRTLAVGHVAGEAASVDEPTVLPQHVGADGDVLDRAVLAPHPGLVVPQLRARPEPPKDVLDHLPVRMELGDVMADVLLRGVAEQVELGAVRPENGPVRPNPVQADGGIVEKVGQLALATAKLLLHSPAVGDVHQHIHRPDELSPVVKVRRGGRLHEYPASVGSFDDDLFAAEFLALAQAPRHPAVIVTDKLPVRREKPG